MSEVSCWKCKHFERVRMSAFCHGGKRVKRIPQKCWYSGELKFCTDFESKKQEADNKSNERPCTVASANVESYKGGTV